MPLSVRPPRWGEAVSARLDRLADTGAPEAAAAGVLMAMNLSFPTWEPPESAPPAALWLDLLMCLGAGVVGRWPRVGTVGVALGLLGWMAVGLPQASWSVFAVMVPVLSHAARGRRHLREPSALVLLALTCLVTVPMSTTPTETLNTVIIWVVLILSAWALGILMDRLHRATQKERSQRVVALRSQRHGIARDLHDTVAYSTSTMVMRAEQMKLRTDDPQMLADLDFIVATGRRSIRDLRAMMETLRRNEPSLEDRTDEPWQAAPLGDLIPQRQAELAAHGLTLHASVDVDADALPASVRGALAKLVVEATSNMVKHAAPGACQLMIEEDGDTVEAVFTNPINPQRPDAPAAPHGGLGLVGAAERIEALGGELEASRQGDRWVLRAQVPVGE